MVSETSSPFDALPEDCISKIISFTSPRDACVVASLSKNFGSAVNSDSVWEKFLPPDYHSLIRPSSRVFSSKKELYFSLCNDSVLIEDGKKSLWLDKATGKRCIMLSANKDDISWGNSLGFWEWISSVPESRFEKVAELLTECPFQINCVMDTRILSPRTHYSAYIVYKTGDRFNHDLENIGVGLIGQGTHEAKSWENNKDTMKLEEREDGWMEAEFGEFFNHSLLDVSHVSIIYYADWKPGFIIQGIEFRPVKCR